MLNLNLQVIMPCQRKQNEVIQSSQFCFINMFEMSLVLELQTTAQNSSSGKIFKLE